MSDRKAILERVVYAKNPAELADAYAEWAKDYDADLVDKMGYEAPFEAAALLQGQLGSTDSKILDAGCGTGLVGKALHALGYTAISTSPRKCSHRRKAKSCTAP
mgnify:CR=1 FL=1